MASEKRPILNPVLSFKVSPQKAPVTGRGADEKQIKKERLGAQRRILGAQLSGFSRDKSSLHADRILIAIKMFDDSLAPSYQPDAVFREGLGAKLVAPVRNGYLAQVKFKNLEDLANLVQKSENIDVKVAVSRIAEIAALGENEILGGREIKQLWDVAVEDENGRLFSLWLAPYYENAARESVVKTLDELHEKQEFFGLNDLVEINVESHVITESSQNGDVKEDSFSRASTEYLKNRYTKVNVVVKNKKSLRTLIASGAVFRIEPVRPLTVSKVPSAPDPVRPSLNQPWQPIVGVVDGGLFASSYDSMVAWTEKKLVQDAHAHRVHGNHVSSLIIQGSEWNTHLDLPPLVCRIGVAQAIAKDESGAATRVKFADYLDKIVTRNAKTTKVWNFSFNECMAAHDPLEMSELGHQIRNIARKNDILPVISIGNVGPDNTIRLNPPADCEAALTVGGRMADGKKPGEACSICLPGPGPEGLKKPELSWFSTLRGIGGGAETGSSYAAAITSALAAHTFHNLKSPTPDLVRALLINTADRDSHDYRLGWGSPRSAEVLPWECHDGSVTLVWSADLHAGEWYYWKEIPIPPELIHDNKLKGRVALTAVLNPLVAGFGAANYFSTRLQVALQYKKKDGKTGNLAGSMREDSDPEALARTEHSKWNPIRHHVADIPNGKGFSGEHLTVCARIFGRDLYQFDINGNSGIAANKVAFALTLSASVDSSTKSSIYNSFTAKLGAHVESAVNEVNVEVEG